MEDIRPDWSFMKQLHSLNKKLGVKFNGTHFIITFLTDKFGEVNIWKVVAADGGFRQPDQRELELLRESNLENAGKNERFNLIVEYMKKFHGDARAKRKEDILHATLENRIQLVQGFNRLHGSGKGNSAFRRIEVR